MSQTESLRNRILRASGWTFGAHVFSQAMRFGSNLLMTRLLMPEMFGIMTIALLFPLIISLFSDLGIRQSVISSRQGTNLDFLNTAWVAQILRGLLVCLACLVVSVSLYMANQRGWLPQGSTYSEPILPLVLAAISLNALISGFESTKLLTASREIALGRITAIELTSQLVGLITMLVAALASRSIWAMVAGSLISALAKTVLSHVALPGTKNQFRWDSDAFWEILRFGKWIFASSILGAALGSGDRFLLGGMVSADKLGLYSIALLIASAAKESIQKLLSNVAYPALSEVARLRPEALKDTYYKFRFPIDLAGLFIVGVLSVSGSEIIKMLYDPRYLAAGNYLEILAWSLLTISTAIAGQCYLAIGKPALLTAVMGVSIISLYTSLPLAYYYFGFDGALWAIALYPCLCIPLVYYFNYRNGLLCLRRELTLLWGFPIGWATGHCLNMLCALTK